MNSLGVIALAGASVALLSGRAAADEGRLLDDETFSYRPHHCAVYDGGFVLAAPTALPTGLARGIALGVTVGQTFAWGVRASYASASEDGEAWAVTHREVRAVATGSVQHVLGRGVVGLRAGLGGTFVHEHRMRHQGERAGLEGAALEAKNLALLPTATLEATLGLHVRGAWMLQLSAGPSVSLVDGSARGAWSAALGVAWHP